VTGIEIAVGYVFAWAVRKLRRVAPRADEEVDRTLDAGMDRLHDLVSRKLATDPALERVLEEARNGSEELSDLTRRRLELSLEDASVRDDGFAKALAQAVTALQEASGATPSRTVTASGTRSVAVGGNAGRIVTGDHVVLPAAASGTPVKGPENRPADQPVTVEATGERAVSVGEDAAEIITGDGSAS